MDDKKIVSDFLKSKKLTVLATVNSENKPQASVMKFAITDNFELIFDTFITYRKYKNLKDNSNVAFVIGWDDEITVQFEGQALELQGKDIEKYKKIFAAKDPKHVAKWEAFPETRFFKVAPKWIRYSDYRKRPFKFIELKF